MVQERERPLRERLESLLALGLTLEEERGACSQSGVLAAYRGRLQAMEHLTEDWERRLHCHRAGEIPWATLTPLLEKVLVYDLFRFFLLAVYDGRPLVPIKTAIFHALAVADLCRGLEDAGEMCEVIRLYSKEIEHNDANQAALYRCFCRRRGRYGAAGVAKGIEELFG